jgi:hypothetical protein
MDIFLSFIIILAMGCIVYSIHVFRHQSRIKIYSDGWTFQKEAGHLYFTYKNAAFTGECEFGGDGDGLDRRFVVKTIRIRLKGHPSELAGWAKSDLYAIEQHLLAEFPESYIRWEEPMLTLISEEK